MKSLLLICYVVVGVSATLNLYGEPLDGHKHLHETVQKLLGQLSGTKFHSEMNRAFERTQRDLVQRIHPYLTHSGIKILDPKAFNSLLHHLLYTQSRHFVNTSKALDNVAQSAVLRLHKAQMLNVLTKLHTLQRNLAAFFNQLHNDITRQAQQLLRKHGVRLGTHHVHFLIHISAKAIFDGKKLHEVIAQHLRVILDKPMSKDQHRRLIEAAVELAKKIQEEVRTQLHDQIKLFLTKKTLPAATHPIFMQSALHHFRPLMHHCPPHMFGAHYHHYKELAKKAFGKHLDHHKVMMHLHGYTGPVTQEHMNRLAAILRKHNKEPQHSVIGYLGAYHLRPADEEAKLPWYKCFLRRMHGLVRIAWLVFAVVLGGALLGTAIWVIVAKCGAKKKVVTAEVVKSKKPPVVSPSKLPYVSLVEEKVPIEA